MTFGVYICPGMNRCPRITRSEGTCGGRNSPPLPTLVFSDVDTPVIYQALHGFSDASSVAYGAVIYLRRVHADRLTTVTLVITKARVLPLKPITTPKAELLAAHLLAKQIVKTASVLDIPTASLYAWSDSEIVLH